jgi:DNA-binding transcriptional ArsR family regulator
MSMGEEPDRQATLRAMAHPVRLQIMSLLTAAGLTAAEVARELGLTHANASYHLRNLHAAGLVVLAGEEKIRGGVAKRYRYDATAQQQEQPGPDPDRSLFTSFADELLRRSAAGRWDGPKVLADADFWIEPGTWQAIRQKIGEAVQELHAQAKPPRTPGTVRTSTTVALFEMDSK